MNCNDGDTGNDPSCLAISVCFLNILKSNTLLVHFPQKHVPPPVLHKFFTVSYDI